MMLNSYARESKARTEMFLRELMISDHGPFSSYEGRQRATNRQYSWAFSGMHKALDDWILALTPASPAQGPHHHKPR